MTATFRSQKPNNITARFFWLFILSIFFHNISFAKSVEIPSFVNDICVSCHYISSMDISGGSSGGDLSLVMKKAQEFGGLDGYLYSKYKVKSDMFFLYPSNYVPSMAIVEGKLFTPDIERMVLFLESIPPETKFVFMWCLPTSV